MRRLFTRTLERRGIYTGAYESDNLGGRVLPRPAFYVVVNRPDTGMVRIEVGFGRRSFWVDWGNRP